MALEDRISFDLAGASHNKKDALLKGLAVKQGIFDENGDPDISAPATLVSGLKNMIANDLKVWAKEAEKRDLIATFVKTDIADI